MKKVKFLILGAGPSGLALAHTLVNQGVSLENIQVLEKENSVGGLCRSAIVDGAPIDIGGGHFLDTKHREVLELLFQFLPENEWNHFSRNSKIHLFSKLLDYPLESNLWQLDNDRMLDYLESISKAGCVQGVSKPEDFTSWIRWKLGERIAEDYMLPYNRKIWSTDLDSLGTYWLHKLPDVSFREVLSSCLAKTPKGQLPAHRDFLYPKKYGYGEVWTRMGSALNNSLQTNVEIQSIDIESLSVNNEWKSEIIFNTIPWHHWSTFSEIPSTIETDIKSLRKTSIDIDYIPDSLPSEAHWIYEPDERIRHHRKLLRSNFCPGSRGYWTETNSRRSESSSSWRHHNEFAYPLNCVDKPIRISRILDWAKDNKIIGLGRWGTWEHMNSDIAVLQAIRLGVKAASDSLLN